MHEKGERKHISNSQKKLNYELKTLLEMFWPVFAHLEPRSIFNTPFWKTLLGCKKEATHQLIAGFIMAEILTTYHFQVPVKEKWNMHSSLLILDGCFHAGFSSSDLKKKRKELKIGDGAKFCSIYMLENKWLACSDQILEDENIDSK